MKEMIYSFPKFYHQLLFNLTPCIAMLSLPLSNLERGKEGVR